MTDTIIFEQQVQPRKPAGDRLVIAVAGNPNAGKTTLFNALTGIRAKTSNFPGTTVELKRGTLSDSEGAVTLLDLPGMYSLKPSTPDEQVACDILLGSSQPDAVLVVVDATNLERNLLFASQLLELDIPIVIALTMMDIADRHGVHIDLDGFRKELGCAIVPVSARTGDGLHELRSVLLRECATLDQTTPSYCRHCRGCPLPDRHAWSRTLCSRCVQAPATPTDQQTDRLDRWLTHPVYGLATFLAVMMGVFFLIFRVAEWPMDWIDGAFGTATAWLEAHMADHWIRDLLANGVLAGVGGILVFLPQICLLFLALSLLEDTGYLARAALVMDRWMKRVGLPGKAFVPLLSAHACAIPAIMATRVLEHPRDRLLTILVAPLLSCSARLPVYIMIAGLLVPGQPMKAALLLSGAYVVGIGAALGAAFVFRHTVLPGAHQPLLIELPAYRWPGLRAALLYTLDRGVIFLKQAGTLILLFSIIMWWLASFPAQAPTGATAEGEPAGIETSYAGQIGRFIEPVIRPLGFDWQIGIGLISSFAAREVLVSTMAIVYGMEGEDEESATLLQTLRTTRRADGTAVFTAATCMSLLVFYILAAQCIPTQIVTRRETGTWKWALIQFSYMNVLAYVAAFFTYQGLRFFGIA